MEQPIKCHICGETVMGSVTLRQGQNYLGDDHYRYVCENHSLSLEELKTLKRISIDQKTMEIIFRGFVFDDHLFSLSLHAQANWTGLAAMLNSGLYTEADFPFALSDMEDIQYNLTWENRWNFLNTAKMVITQAKISGTVFKQQILDAATVEELNAVIDVRS